MSNDDTRGNESPDRRDESRQPTTYRPILEHIDTHAIELLEAITDDPTLEPMTRLRAKRHCRELRAETESLRRHLLESDERRAPTGDGQAGGIERVSGPFEALREASRRDDGETGYERDDTEDESDD